VFYPAVRGFRRSVKEIDRDHISVNPPVSNHRKQTTDELSFQSLPGRGRVESSRRQYVSILKFVFATLPYQICVSSESDLSLCFKSRCG
jgi:hypothetical protein